MMHHTLECTGTHSSRINRTELSTVLFALEDAIATSARSGEALSVGLLLIQMRNFSRLNVSLGYRAGDFVVTEMAARLAFGFEDRGRVMRVGAGKFAVVLWDLKTNAHALLAAKKVERLSKESIEVAGESVTPDLTQGMAIYPEHAGCAEELLQRAEIALDEARETEHFIALYRDELSENIRSSSHVEAALSRGLSEGSVEPYFQTQFDLRSGAPCGAEALLRCKDDSGTLLDAEVVIGVAERSGRLPQLTSLMLNAALRHAAEWPAAMMMRRVAVNVGTQSLKDPDFVESVSSALGIWDASPDNLTIEITENALMDEPTKSFDTLHRLRELGVRVAIDDFGTGYSSLSYFKGIPANELKVDKDFVLNMLHDEADQKIVRTVIDLAHSFDLEVVAEGVEDEATYDMLQKMGCDIVQGYWIGRPLPAAEFLKSLSDRLGP